MPRGKSAFKDDATRLEVYAKIVSDYPAKNVEQLSAELGIPGQEVYTAIQYMRKLGIKIPKISARLSTFKPLLIEYIKANKPELLK